MLPGNSAFYELSMKLWEGLEQDLDYNAMVSQRGVINLFHSDAQRDAYIRRGNAMMMEGIDAEFLERRDLQRELPFLAFDDARFPIKGGLAQRRQVQRPGRGRAGHAEGRGAAQEFAALQFGDAVDLHGRPLTSGSGIPGRPSASGCWPARG